MITQSKFTSPILLKKQDCWQILAACFYDFYKLEKVIINIHSDSKKFIRILIQFPVKKKHVCKYMLP